ncbi:uncharacterized protein LOC143347251 [Colletes latitarsis]|uniref:uncharacterized protein LOC143347251 n=1 Tax=Colletes latitarsis TaxID=2605962 RepID=UPI004036A5BB
MSIQCVRNPMYALCLLAAVCVRQHVQTRSVQPLTKGFTVQPPTVVFTKPNEASLKSAINSNNAAKNNKKCPKLQEADTLVKCVQNFATRARRFVSDIRTNFAVSKQPSSSDPDCAYNVLDSLLYLTSSFGTKWVA